MRLRPVLSSLGGMRWVCEWTVALIRSNLNRALEGTTYLLIWWHERIRKLMMNACPDCWNLSLLGVNADSLSY